jgi:SAM-dependent MidA family methyltransferase
MPKDKTNIYQEFKNRLNENSMMPFDEFVNLALYHPTLGYYSQRKERVGKSDNSDFYTSNSIGSPWGELIVEACTQILKPKELKNYTFIEIAAEPDCSILNQIDHPFESTMTYRLGDSIEIPYQSIVFSNEWLDAQPFKRFRFDGTQKEWMEIGVNLLEKKFTECFFQTKQSAVFPKECIDGYTIDWPTGARTAIDEIISQNWRGLFLTFDYGLSRNTILQERPEGTARGYSKHKINTDLLSMVGGQDLTCHLCWDELIDCLKSKKFFSPKLQSQESFFMHHSQNSIKQLIEKSNDPLDSKLQKLKELIHPQHLGNKFQALWAVRK